jgi:hypothetical protein
MRDRVDRNDLGGTVFDAFQPIASHPADGELVP